MLSCQLELFELQHPQARHAWTSVATDSFLEHG